MKSLLFCAAALAALSLGGCNTDHVGVAAVIAPAPVYAGEMHGPLSESESHELNRLLARKDEALMGPPRRNFIHFGFVGDMPTAEPVPPHCHDRVVNDWKLRRQFHRVECPGMKPPAGLHRVEW